ncbi:MAG: T9SS type A sorting domain-containing protein [Bacteroidia bacterium]
MRFITPILTLLISLQCAWAQIASTGIPVTDRLALPAATTTTLPSIPLQHLLAEDERDSKNGLPPRFGYKIDLNASLENSGTWHKLPGEGRVWRMRVLARGAYSINFLFDEFDLPAGAQLFIYNDDKSYRIGAFTERNELPDGRFATAPVKGEAVTLELFEPAGHIGESRLLIGQAVHAYVNLFEQADRVLRDFGDSGPCNNDVECKKAGWEDQINSVGMVIVGGNRQCSGAMVNNTLNDGTPYFLTANHCNSSFNAGDILGTYVFVFNYQSPTCNGPDGNLSQSIAGGILRAKFEDSDMNLIEISLPPPSAYNVYYSGWDRRNIPADSSVAIHHPSNDVKKITFNNDQNVSSPGLSGVPDSHWQVTEWEDGTTEGGSSGSPLFNQDKRVVGQLHGGSATCFSNTEDEFGKLAMSWAGGGTPGSRLSDWLDPAGSGSQFIDGSYTFTRLAWDIDVLDIQGIGRDLCDTVIFPEIVVRNLGDSAVSKFTIDYQIDNNPVGQLIWTGQALVTTASVTVPIGPLIVGTGTHSLAVTISSPNDSTDMVPTNNQLSENFNAKKGNAAIIRLFADNFPDETTIFLRRQSDYSLIFQEENFRPNTFNTIPLCLDDDCFTLVITDDAGDGLEGNFIDGFLLLEVDGVVIDSIGPAFGDSASVDFCLPLPLVSDFEMPDSACMQSLVYPKNNSTGAFSFQWIAQGADPATSTDRYPTFSWASNGSYEVRLIVTDQNGQVDSSSQQIYIMEGSPLVVDLATDAFPEETSYKIFDANGNEVASHDRFRRASRLYTDHYCFAPGCYQFVIYDSEGDGICCDYGAGSFNLRAAGGRLLGQGGQFRFSDTVSFCLENVDIDPALELPELHIFPNPARDNLFVESSVVMNSLSCFDLLGKEIMSQKIRAESFDWDIRKLNSGMYILKIETAAGSLTRTFIKD